MSLSFRLGTVAFIMAMMALALYILTAGILGRRIHRKSLALFFICGEVIQWSAMFLYLLYTVVTGQEDMPSAVFDTAGYLLMALILGLMMSRLHHLPLLFSVKAAVPQNLLRLYGGHSVYLRGQHRQQHHGVCGGGVLAAL